MGPLIAIVAGLLSGVGFGWVLQRGQLCFHATIATALEGRFLLARGWALGVSLAAVGLSVLYLLPGTEVLNEGLAFRPVRNVAGGLVFGAGMVIASSCVSGLFYKLGAGMLGALVGLAGWATGELVAREIQVPGPTVLGGGIDATVPGVLGLPRLGVAVAVLAVTLVVLWRRPGLERPAHGWQWGWRPIGLGLGAVTVTAWALAAMSDTSFGPSTVGAVTSLVDGDPRWWLVAFLPGIVLGGHLAARARGGLWLRGEDRVRYAELGLGGVLLGGGAWIAGGCNLGHGVSGMAQLNISSIVAVASMVAGVALTRQVRHGLLSRRSAGQAVSPRSRT